MHACVHVCVCVCVVNHEQESLFNGLCPSPSPSQIFPKLSGGPENFITIGSGILEEMSHT